jgi:hypothetical protein
MEIKQIISTIKMTGLYYIGICHLINLKGIISSFFSGFTVVCVMRSSTLIFTLCP